MATRNEVFLRRVIVAESGLIMEQISKSVLDSPASQKLQLQWLGSAG